MKIETATIRRLSEALLKSGRRSANVHSSAYETLTRQGLLSAEERAAVARVDPLGEIMFLMMSADGKLENPERDAILGAIRGLTGDLLHPGTVNVMIESYDESLKREGRDARLSAVIQEVADQPAEAEGAFALAAAIALADSSVADQEREFIERLAGKLSITAERAREILEQLDEDHG